jgi:hypothetical protein
MWEDNDKMDLEGKGRKRKESICLAQDRNEWWVLVKTVMCFRVPRLAEIS